MTTFEKMQEVINRSPTDDRSVLRELLDRLCLTALYTDDYKMYRAYALVITDDIRIGDFDEFMSLARDYWEETEDTRERNLTPH